MQAQQSTMEAAAIDKFGGPEAIRPHTLPLPGIEPDEILIRVESAGVGTWDPVERQGGFVDMMEQSPRFPYVLGSDGAGTIAAVGQQVTGFKEGDHVYALEFLNPKGGFYAQYTAVKARHAAPIPARLTVEQAGAMPVDALTALTGLDNVLNLKAGESVLVFGASGGVGHLAVQLAKRMGCRVLAVASGEDGVALAQRLGADAVVDGRKEDIAAAALHFAPQRLDAALLTAGGRAAADALEALHDGGRAAYPNGVQPIRRGRSGIDIRSYDMDVSRQTMEKLNRLIAQEPFEVHVARAFPLDQAAEAHRALDEHFLGKLILRPS